MNGLELSNGLVVLDEARRLYVALSRDGSYYHVIQPATEVAAKSFEYTSDEGLLVQPVAPGELICTCAGGRFHRHCYRTGQAETFERERASGLQRLASEADWGLEPVGTAR